VGAPLRVHLAAHLPVVAPRAVHAHKRHGAAPVGPGGPPGRVQSRGAVRRARARAGGRARGAGRARGEGEGEAGEIGREVPDEGACAREHEQVGQRRAQQGGTVERPAPQTVFGPLVLRFGRRASGWGAPRWGGHQGWEHRGGACIRVGGTAVGLWWARSRAE